MALVATYQPPDFLDPMECPPIMDHGSRRMEPFDVDELIRRLESYRQEVKLNQVRAKSEALKANRASMSYQPRYSRTGDSYRNDKSRRQTRIFDIDQDRDKDSESDAGQSVNSAETQLRSKRDSGWITSKQLMGARDRDSPSPSRRSIERIREEEADFKRANRRSLAMFDSARTSPFKSDRESSGRESAASRARPISSAFENFHLPQALRPTTPLISNPYTSMRIDDQIAQQKKDRRRTWVPPQKDRNDWAQITQRGDFPAPAPVIAAPQIPSVPRETWLEKVARRRSKIMLVSPVSAPRQASQSTTRLEVPRASERQKQGTKRPSALTGASTESVTNLAAATKQEKWKKVKKAKSLFDLFRRHKD